MAALAACLATGLAASCTSPSGGRIIRVDLTAARLPPPGMAWVIFGSDTVRAEVAGTHAAHEQGLRGRRSVPDGTGMLFVFPSSEQRLFWMKDTPVALDIAFFGDANQVLGIKQMEALDESLTDSDVPTAMVLEVRKGWFAERGIEVGAVAEIVFGPGL